VKLLDVIEGTTTMTKSGNERIDPSKKLEAFVLRQRNLSGLEIP